jgi:adenylosuccinate synthase
VIVRYSNWVNHYKTLNVTKLDILDGLDEIKVCIDYNVDGRELESFPGMPTHNSLLPPVLTYLNCSRPQATWPRRADLQVVPRMVYLNRRMYCLERTSC